MPAIASSLSPNLSLKRTVRKPSVRSKGGIVVTQNRVASEVGARVLERGRSCGRCRRGGGLRRRRGRAVDERHRRRRRHAGADAKSGKMTAIDFGGRSPKGLKVEDFPLAGGHRRGQPVRLAAGHG